MTHLKENPTLADLQEYMQKVCEERGWDNSNPLELFLLFGEEVGELAKAIRNMRGLYQEEAKKDRKFELEEEFADVLGYLLDLANHFQIDLEAAFRKKEAINAQREWN
ncbi:MAG: MazG nucleotide pyrophosphohydrolase domain-containing protein [Microscillaceae bacterium]|nr:MazG nucleotide pyrophosphohydrolase domain-containing protein [Microscillaceae bacterium]